MTEHTFTGGPVLVVGCGLIGTSVALALRELDVAVHLRDRERTVVEMAVAVGAGTAEPVEAPQLVVVAVPPSATPDTVSALLAEFPDAVVTDVASVKQPVVSVAAAADGSSRFVGGHPMAGTERSGPVAGSARLFEGRPWAVVPTPDSTPAAISLVEEVASSLQAVPLRMAADAHDDAVALVSHVPHLVSVLTAGLLASAPRDHLELAGPGLRDVTRIAGSGTGMWLDILDSNARSVRELLVSLRSDLDRVLDALDSGGEILAGRMADVLDAGRAGTRRIPGKHGATRIESAAVLVPVEDRPGELSRLMADVGASGVNLEDLSIDHEYGRPVGLAAIEVAVERADHLVASLTERGWPAYR